MSTPRAVRNARLASLKRALEPDAPLLAPLDRFKTPAEMTDEELDAAWRDDNQQESED